MFCCHDRLPPKIFPSREPTTHAPGAPQRSIREDGYTDYVGAIHIHTTYSHDAMGTFEEAVRVANAQRLDYIIITEHNTLQPLRDGKQGWHGATLVLIGLELSTSAGHYLTFNVTQEIDRSLPIQHIVDEVNRQGGLGFIAHPYYSRAPWRNYNIHGFLGIEGYNTAHDTLDENKLRLGVWTITSPEEIFYDSIVDRPVDPLAKWDELIRTRGRTVGIGSTDAHEFHVFGLHLAPYRILFQLSRTHVLIRGPLSPESVYDAFRAGHVYFALELTAEAKGFSFLAHTSKQVVGIMGDEIPLQPDLTFSVYVPGAAQLTCFKDGAPIAFIIGQTWELPVTEPGAYRIEASRYNKPWIFSNPIYVQGAASESASAPAQPVVPGNDEPPSQEANPRHAL